MGTMRIALTGGIASGKTFVARDLERHGATLIDADVLAREVVEPGTDGLAAIVERFGEGILHDDGTLDRPALGRIVFFDESARRDLNAIVHPRVRARAAEVESSARSDDLIVHVIPLLVEAGLVDDFDHVMVVDVPESTQLARLQERDGLSLAEAQARLDAQATRAERRAVATWVIDNSGSREETRDHIAEWVGQHYRR